MTEQTAADETADETQTTGDDPSAADQATTTEQAAPPADDGAPKSAAEAIDAALDGKVIGRITPTAEETPEAKEAAIEAVKQEDEAQAEKGQVRGADGKFRPMTAEEKAAKEAAKKVDPVEDPIPDEVKGRTRERMQELIKTVKEQAVLAEQHNALFGAIQETGATPDEFATMISYMKAAHSNDPAMLKTAHKLLQSELRGLMTRLGEPVEEVNLLNEPENKDLADEIRAGKLSLQRGHELAAARESRKAVGSRATAATAAEKAKREAETATATGRADLDKLDGELRTRDGNEVFQRKYDLLVPALQDAFSRIHPSKWRETFTAAYDRLKLPAAPAAVAAPKVFPARPKQPAGSGGGKTAPTSALEAISQALDGV